MVEIVPTLPEETEVLRIRQLAAVRRFLEAVVVNRKATGVSGLTDSVRRETQTRQKMSKRAQGGAK